jgi:hypothetical protein
MHIIDVKLYWTTFRKYYWCDICGKNLESIWLQSSKLLGYLAKAMETYIHIFILMVGLEGWVRKVSFKVAKLGEKKVFTSTVIIPCSYF